MEVEEVVVLVLWSLGGFLRGVSCVLVQDYCPSHEFFFRIIFFFAVAVRGGSPELIFP